MTVSVWLNTLFLMRNPLRLIEIFSTLAQINGVGQHFYSPLPATFPGPGPGTHFHPMPGGHLQPQSMPHSQHSPSPPNSYHKDERTQRQHTKLLRKLDQKQREMNSEYSFGSFSTRKIYASIVASRATIVKSCLQSILNSLNDVRMLFPFAHPFPYRFSFIDAGPFTITAKERIEWHQANDTQWCIVGGYIGGWRRIVERARRRGRCAINY